MRTNILTLCDFAKEYGGQLTVTGTFNNILSNVFPTEPISFYIVCQFVIVENIIGSHSVSVSVTEKGTKKPLIKTQEFKLDISEKSNVQVDRNFITNLILKMESLKFEKPGTYTIEVNSDKNVQKLDFYVTKA